MSKVPKFQFEDYPPAKHAKAANLQPVGAPTLASLAALAVGGKENQNSHAPVETRTICPKCQGEIILRTSFGKKYCYQCITELDGENGIRSTGFTEVDRVLEEAIEKAAERSAILEHDGGLERKQADETARDMHIQPAIEGLMRSGLIDIEDGSPRSQMKATPPAKVAKVANLQPIETPQARPPASPVTCAAACSWYASNPWSHDPTLLGWCHRRMEHLVAGSPACEEFRRGVPPRQPYEQVPAVPTATSPAPQEHVLTCADCPHFQPNSGPNPQQAWGRCLKRGRGRFGCAVGCRFFQEADR